MDYIILVILLAHLLHYQFIVYFRMLSKPIYLYRLHNLIVLDTWFFKERYLDKIFNNSRRIYYGLYIVYSYGYLVECYQQNT